jgi:hypothetical protein
MRWLLATLFFPALAHAQETDRRIQALPALVEQRNVAMDGLALCSGDLQALKKENTELKAELEKLKLLSIKPKE